MKPKLITIVAALVLASTPVHAQEQQLAMGFVTTPETVLEQATPAAANVYEGPLTFDEWVDEFANKFQPVGQAQGGRTYYAGDASVRVGLLDPHFGQELALAYEKAMFDLRADFVMQNYGRLVSESVRDFYLNNSSNKDLFDPAELQQAGKAGGSRLDAILNKAITLVDKQLDNALIEQGVPAEQVQQQTIEQKRTNAKNNLTKEAVKSAFSNMQGLVPVQTRIFTVETDNGTLVTLGIIAVQSEKTRQFALDMARKRPTNVKGTPRTLSDLLPQDPSGYLNEIGLRFGYDQNGSPMLLSYGRSSVSVKPDWTPSEVFNATKGAKSIAQTLAEASIVEFMNTSVRVDETTLNASQEERLVSQLTHFENGTPVSVEPVREQIGETISTILKSGRSTAVGDLRGTAVVKRWEQKDENKILHLGTVVAWTYDQLANANAIDAQARGQKASGQASAAPATANPINRGSKAINRPDDF